VNAVRTHIEHFIGSNPLLASTSCTDPVNNLKSPSKRARVETPRIVVNVTESIDGGDKMTVRSRSCSPFWAEGQTSTYSEEVKTGRASRDDDSGSVSPAEETGHEGAPSSGFGLLAAPRTTRRARRSRSPKDKNARRPPDEKTSRDDELDTCAAASGAKPAKKRRPRSRRNNRRSRKKETDVPEIVVSSSSAAVPSSGCGQSPGGEYSDRCRDLDERLTGIFGSADKQRYGRHDRAFDRPRSKSDTRDLNTFAHIVFTAGQFADVGNHATPHTCRRFELSGAAEPAEYDSNTRVASDSSSLVRCNVLSSPFARNDAEPPPPPTERRRWSDDHEHGQSVRRIIACLVSRNVEI